METAQKQVDWGGWVRDKEGNPIRRWFTTIGDGGDLRVWPPKLENLHALEKKRWKGLSKLTEWDETQGEPMRDRLNALTGPLVGDCPDDRPSKLILMRGNYTNPTSPGRWNWYREEDHGPLTEYGDGQELVNEWWYVIQRERTMRRMYTAYHTAFTEVLYRRYMKLLYTPNGRPKWRAIRMTINGREYIFKAEQGGGGGTHWIEFVVTPEDTDVLAIPDEEA